MPRHPSVSPRTDAVGEHVYSQLAERAAEASDKVFPLHVGDTYLEPPMAARAESQRSKDNPGLHRYAPTQGLPELLTAIQQRLGAIAGEDALSVPLEQIQVMPGATAGLNIVCEAVLEAGDELLLPSPFWPLIRGMNQLRGVGVVEVPFYTRLDEADFDAEQALEAAITERTAAIYLNTPNNPTGRVLDDAALSAIARVAERHDLWVLSDEAYQDLWFGADAPTPVWSRPDLRERTIATHTLSKSYGLAGARIGYTHGPAEVMRRVRAMQTYITYCAAQPMQRGGAKALLEGGSFIAQCRAAYRAAGKVAADTFGVAPPEGGTFIFVDVAHLLGDDVPSVDALLERCADVGVLLSPGRAMGVGFETYVRVCFTSVPPDELGEAMTRIAPFFTR